MCFLPVSRVSLKAESQVSVACFLFPWEVSEQRCLVMADHHGCYEEGSREHVREDSETGSPFTEAFQVQLEMSVLITYTFLENLFYFSYMKRQLISAKHNNHILECQILKSCLHLNGHFQNRGKEGGLNILRITG